MAGLSRRNPYNDCAGYLASRRSGSRHGWVVIYRAADQGIDVGGNPYAVVCETHATICGVASMPKARTLMKSAEFCEACMASEGMSSLTTERSVTS